MRLRTVVVTLAGIIPVVGLAGAQPSSIKVKRIPPGQKIVKPDDSAWMKEDWNPGNDASFLAVRKDIDAKFAAHVMTPEIITGDAKECDNTNAVAVFRVAYAIYEATRQIPPVKIPGYCGTLFFEHCKPPHSYEYTRLHFLSLAVGASDPSLIPVGERLLAYDHSDYDVKYQLTACLGHSPNRAERELGIRYANELISQYPSCANSYAALGGIYFYDFMVSRGTYGGQEAAAAYKNYLRLAPAADPWRKQAVSIIDYVEHYKIGPPRHVK